MRQHTETAKKLADIADSTHQRLTDFEAKLTEIHQSSKERLKAIEGLLPGATSAGLASAFNSRRQDFTRPQIWWQSLFIASLLALLALAMWEPFSHPASTGELTWNAVGLFVLHRLPFALPLIWLAFHAGHRAALAQRVGEDYAFKEVVSRSFEGYRREMAEIDGKAAPDSALSDFCASVLRVITSPPGRIYEKHKLNNTPLNALAESVGPIAKVISRLKPSEVLTHGVEAKLSLSAAKEEE